MNTQSYQMNSKRWAKQRNGGVQGELRSLFRIKMRTSLSARVKYTGSHNQLVNMSQINNAAQSEECTGDNLILEFRRLNTNTPQLYSKLVSLELDVVLQMSDGVSHQINNIVV